MVECCCSFHRVARKTTKRTVAPPSSTLLARSKAVLIAIGGSFLVVLAALIVMLIYKKCCAPKRGGITDELTDFHEQNLLGGESMYDDFGGNSTKINSSRTDAPDNVGNFPANNLNPVGFTSTDTGEINIPLVVSSNTLG